ncbi:hypothetical protein M9H77_19405 [Catharanthus roseus]|uniref:Uncharacterized protein n=1 Tax=Catharanthus roseus TaxID=4058 RepID=A0ACC0BAB1_CATRO|nr:hypothetical protein M9H77_19405 [Catharanthus roseus]
MMPTSNIDSLLKTGVIRNPASGPPYSASHRSKARKVIITQELQNTSYLSHGNVQSPFRYRDSSIGFILMRKPISTNPLQPQVPLMALTNSILPAKHKEGSTTI